MKKIAVVTATRAEYGLLSPVIKELREKESDEFKLCLIVTGTHLSEQYGMTVDEIDDRIDHRIEIPVNSDSERDISVNQAITLVKFTEIFLSEKFEAIIILGDRYESLAIAIAAGNTRTPIFHMCGGDTTEGAIDEWIRHSITKMSYLHFVTNEISRNRVIQLGEDPSRVFNYGSTSIDNVLAIADMEREEALMSIGLSDCKYALCTYHPVTLDSGSVDQKVSDFISSIEAFPDIQFIVTKSNADQGGSRINELLEEAKKEVPNLHVFTSLGTKRYLSLMKHAEFVLGNSSSGIIETPAFRIPTVNIGDRQRGRLHAKNVIDCDDRSESIISAINVALSDEYIKICSTVVSPYGSGDAGKKIASKAYEIVMSGNIELKKKFYDLKG